MVVLGVAEEPPGEVVLVDRRRARCRSRAPRRPASCSRRPAEVEQDRERASAAAGSGVTRATATAAPARWPAHGPTAASSARCSRSRQTMNSQRWRFFELAARRPALRIRTRCSGSSGRSANRRTTRLCPDRVPGGSSVAAGSSSLGAVDRRRVASALVARRRAAPRGPARPSEAAPRARGTAPRVDRARPRPPVGRLGRSGPPRASARNAGDGATVLRCTRTATSAGRRDQRLDRAGPLALPRRERRAGEPPGVLDGTTTSSRPWASERAVRRIAERGGARSRAARGRAAGGRPGVVEPGERGRRRHPGWADGRGGTSGGSAAADPPAPTSLTTAAIRGSAAAARIAPTRPSSGRRSPPT